MSAAETCRANGWQVGQLVLTRECGFQTVEQITAIGEHQILYKQLGHRWVSDKKWQVLQPYEQSGNPFRVHNKPITKLPWEEA